MQYYNLQSLRTYRYIGIVKNLHFLLCECLESVSNVFNSWFLSLRIQLDNIELGFFFLPSTVFLRRVQYQIIITKAWDRIDVFSIGKPVTGALHGTRPTHTWGGSVHVYSALTTDSPGTRRGTNSRTRTGNSWTPWTTCFSLADGGRSATVALVAAVMPRPDALATL